MAGVEAQEADVRQGRHPGKQEAKSREINAKGLVVVAMGCSVGRTEGGRLRQNRQPD